MADTVEFVKIPKAIFDNLEERSARLTTIQKDLYDFLPVLYKYEIRAVVTSPPSGPDAAAVLAAVKGIWNLATIHCDKNA